MSWVKALLLLSCIVLGCADLLTTNVILELGMSEANPIMRLAQTSLGEWWLIPKLGITFVGAWTLSLSNNLYGISAVVAFASTPVLNNLILIAGNVN
ncbi:DUF5658 family protein [Bradyrhizobium sp. OAE829]|uniref:DUF5658 family protein n=1 Tax=Bradyrhizobium sp. OAE829 TaxID=2663807 RepID=UPI001A0FB909